MALDGVECSHLKPIFNVLTFQFDVGISITDPKAESLRSTDEYVELVQAGADSLDRRQV